MSEKPTISEPLKPLLLGFDKSKDHVVVTDKNGVILYANDAAEKHTGYKRDEMLGKEPGELWGGYMPIEFYETMWETIKTYKQTYVGDLKNCRKNGEVYWQEVHIIPILDADGEAQYFIGIELDVDDQERREAILQSCSEVDKAQEGSDPLRVRWPLKWLFESGALSPNQLIELQECYNDGQAIDSLTDDLIAISSVQYNSHFPCERFSLTSLVQKVVDETKKKHPNCSYVFDSKDPYDVYTCKELLYHLLLRIVDNAARYSPDSSGKVSITISLEDKHCIIRFRDNGMGISVQDTSRLYDKYFRGAKARVMYPAGSGLGLYLVKTIADALGWEVSCISKEGEGTVFEIRFLAEKKEQ